MSQPWITQVRKGLTELIVLAALRSGEAYGYELLQRINAVPGLSLSESMVYPLLARLHREECVRVRTAPSSSGPPRRYYELTAIGRTRLAEMILQWRSLGVAVQHILQRVAR